MNFELFQNIDYKNIINLHAITQEYSGNLELVKKIYSRNNKHINENLNFLINIKFFEINKDHINILGKIDKELIFSLIFNQPNYAICIKNYLLNFQEDINGNYIFKPDGYYNILTSHLRNFLITIEYIKNINSSYIILDRSLLIKFKTREFSPKEKGKDAIAYFNNHFYYAT